MVRLTAIAFISLAACQQAGSGSSDADHTLQAIRLDALEERVMRLEQSTPRDYVSFKANEKGFDWLRMQGSNAMVRVGWDETEKVGNGSRITLSIGNPMAMSFRDCTINVVWASTDRSGAVIPSTRHEGMKRIDEALLAGNFVFPKLDLADLPPDSLGLVTFNELNCLRNNRASFVE